MRMIIVVYVVSNKISHGEKMEKRHRSQFVHVVE